MKHDIRKQILFNAVKSGRIKSVQQLVDVMILLGFEKELEGRCLKMDRVSTKHMDKLGTIILTGGNSK